MSIFTLWDKERDQRLSYLRLISRAGGLTPAMRAEKEELEAQFLKLGVGEYPGSVKLLRELHGLWPDGSKMAQKDIEERS